MSNKWRSTEIVSVTLGPAALVWDAGMLYLRALSITHLTPEQREERQRLISGLITLGQEIGAPEQSLAALATYAGGPINLGPSRRDST